MAAYAIFDVDIRDMEQYQKYMQLVKPVIEAAGGPARTVSVEGLLC